LRGVTYRIGAEAKGGKYISPSSSVFCAAKYRGGVRRTEGLKNSDSNKIKYQTLPCRVPQHCGTQKQHREKDYFSILSPCVSVREYRGSTRRARGLKDGGVKNSSNNKIKYQTLPPAVSRSLTRSYKTT